MTEIERILELVSANKLSRIEAKKLLAALSPHVAKLPDSVLEHLFTQLAEHQLSSKAVAQLLEPNLPYAPPAPPAPPMPAMFANRKPARLLHIDIESCNGATVKLNLPLGLANFALKMIPKEAQRTISEQGIDLGVLAEMLKGDLPEGNLVEVESENGDEVRIWIE
jgi:hypothetical protein